MCGRYALFTLSADLIEEILGYPPIDEHGVVGSGRMRTRFVRAS